MFKQSWPIFIIVLSIISVQASSSLAKYLFPLLGPSGMTAWRLIFSSVMLCFIFKPWRNKLNKEALKQISIFGLSLGFMNLFFYSAIELIPIGIAVAIELTGPLMVALFTIKKRLDYIWFLFAIAGLLILLPLWHNNSSLNLVGMIFALLAGGCWAMYIIWGRKAGITQGNSSVALGSLIASFVMVPIAFFQRSPELFSLDIIPLVFVVALLASTIPYALDMIVLPKVPSFVFSVLMSLSPVFGALSGFVFLREQLAISQWFAIFLIIISSVGIVMSLSLNNK